MPSSKIDPDAHALARAFLEHTSATARLLHTRTHLEVMYNWSWLAWAPRNDKDELIYERDDHDFGVVLFAMVHGEKALQVRRQREIVWL